MSSYVVPALIAAACTAGVTLVVRRAQRARDERRAAELWDEEFMTALFEPERGSAADRSFTEVPAPRIPRQDPALAKLASTPAEGEADTFAEAAAEVADAADLAEVTEAADPHSARDGYEVRPDTAAMPPLRSTTPHPSQGLAPMLPAHLTGAHLLGVAARGTAVTGLRSGTAGGLDVFDFADGGSIVVMPADAEVAALIEAALGQDQDVRLLGASEVGGGRALTFQVHEATAYMLADRVYARPAA
ncbi:hypothetical protein [Yinghuangia seranimata]|uniref:hypothetical protein n=1 Tax=Yinghuangia seranimata TaxID=408067 RepID=UPI00248B20D6|nr:hypothetical protein [Yinghuangia seranimata]MDI2128806.1 hypothetical protein [Yinghuangia seranimata]